MPARNSLSVASGRLLRHEDYLSMPWRNGAGVTLEIARTPAAPAPFDWRLSLATVAESGPFSTYGGYRRSVSLVSGAGFRLDINGSEPATLDAIGATSFFSGDVATTCTLLGGSCTDLSLMVRAPGEVLAVRKLELREPCEVPIDTRALNALFCLAGPVRFSGALDDELANHDTLLLHGAGPPLSAQPVGSAVERPHAALLVLSWRAPAFGCARH